MTMVCKIKISNLQSAEETTLRNETGFRLGTGDTDTETEIEKLIEEINQIDEEPVHRTILYNDDFHAFDDVVHIVQFATGKSLKEAYEITIEAHNNGRAVCYAGEKDDCEKVAGILRRAGLIVEVE